MNTHTNDAGGPAFAHSGNDACPRQEGMSLRDYFAGQAMQGLLAQGGWTATGLAETSYQFADAMLALAHKENKEKKNQ